MLQFLEAKELFPDALLFFRMGDFYEFFFEDALQVTRLVDLTLTSRGKGPDGEPIPMAGMPHHAAARYITELLALGRKVAICEQMADPSTVRGVVPREVVRVITPALCLELEALDAKADCLLVAVTGAGADIGLAAYEMSTAELRICALASEAALMAELARLAPRELLLCDELSHLVTTLELMAEVAAPQLSAAPSAPHLGALAQALGEESAAGLTEQLSEAGQGAAVMALAYAEAHRPGQAFQAPRVTRYDPSAQLVLDQVAVRNLELLRTLSGERKGSLLSLLDTTCSPMGARKLRRRLLLPLCELAPLRRRLDAVSALVEDAVCRERVRAALSGVGDVERLTTRAEQGVATPRDLGALRDSLKATLCVAHELADRAPWATDDPLAQLMPQALDAGLAGELDLALIDAPPIVSNAGGIVRDGLDSELDRIRSLASNAKNALLELEQRERRQTGIASLKVKYTRVFGYYIEVTKANVARVPDHYRRKQTVANAERYVTDELSELEDDIAQADERAKALESGLFEDLRRRVSEQAPILRRLADAVATLDVHACLADRAVHLDWTRPELDESRAIALLDSRHPVVEDMMAAGRFVPNDIELGGAAPSMALVTGPNMGGKSTVMRQTALTVILAQMGSYVPARSARIGLVDRVHTRVGANDDLSRGQSTFMLEMRETATILREATARSLVILDEIGRGTSTYDGLAIAWSVAEHLHDAIGCRALFATHYHELCELAETRPSMTNVSVAASEANGEVAFLHRLVPGPADRSYGVHVARLAGVPPIVSARAQVLLAEFEERAKPDPRPQLELFTKEAPAISPELSTLLDTLGALDVDRLTPVDALVALARVVELRRSVKDA